MKTEVYSKSKILTIWPFIEIPTFGPHDYGIKKSKLSFLPKFVFIELVLRIQVPWMTFLCVTFYFGRLNHVPPLEERFEVLACKNSHLLIWDWKKVKVLVLSRVQLFVTPWNVAHQAALSMGFSRQEYWNGLPFPSPGDLPNSGIKPRSPALQADSLTI